jgi:hypothetical protein
MEPTVSIVSVAKRQRNAISLAGVLVGLAFALGNFGCGGGQAAPERATILARYGAVGST